MVALVKPDNRILDTIIQGDCLDVLRTLDTCSVDAIVTDPPAGISFMGKDWDANKGSRDIWINWLSQIMAECLRVLKPGGHALIWALPRTSHWTATAIEDAGFEIRDVLTHLFGSGFPKSMDISKAIDKMQGAEREVIGQRIRLGDKKPYPYTESDYSTMNHNYAERPPLTAPSTPQAQQWDGYGTALKPANEHWILARKPLSESSIAANVLKYGTGGLNIDQCRISHNEPLKTTERTAPRYSGTTMNNGVRGGIQSVIASASPQGRFPSNLLLSHSWLCTDDLCDEQCPIRLLDEQSGILHARGNRTPTKTGTGIFREKPTDFASEYVGDRAGGASRYFTQFCYTAKASRTERNRGCEGLPEKESRKFAGGEFIAHPEKPATTSFDRQQANNHPTVKPLALMSWLCRLITPPNGIVLDCFAGSGSTLVACVQEGFHFIGIEQSAEYAAIARARIAHALREVQG